MQKVLNIALKDLLLTLRDPGALVIMLLAPLALTLAISAALGNSGGSSGGLQHIPVILVNQDQGVFGEYLVQAFSSKEVGDLVQPTKMKDAAAARKEVDQDHAAAAVIVPANFSASIMPEGTQQGNAQKIVEVRSEVEIYANPGSPISVKVIRSIVDGVLTRFVAARASGEVSVSMLLATQRIQPAEAFSVGAQIGKEMGTQNSGAALVTTQSSTAESGASDQPFNWVKYSSPSMAILFLMFTLTSSGRTILVERRHGTLARMLVSPTERATVLAGKMLGVYLTGLVQMAVLILAGELIFGFSWGQPLPLVLLTLALVAAVSGWGLLPAALSRTSGQAATIGSAITLLFGALAGNFAPRMSYPVWLQNLGLITPNAWGIDGYYALINGGGLTDVSTAILALALMTVVTFGLAVLLFSRSMRGSHA